MGNQGPIVPVRSVARRLERIVDWTADDLPIVRVTATACPHCGTYTKPEIVRSRSDYGDGTVQRKCVCRDCGEPWVLMIERDDDGPNEAEAAAMIAEMKRQVGW